MFRVNARSRRRPSKVCGGRGVKIQQPTGGNRYACPLVIDVESMNGSRVCPSVRYGPSPEVPADIHSSGCFVGFFPATGNRNNSSGALNNVGSNGYYWSATPNSATNGYNLNFNSGNVNPSNNNNRSNGFVARCVAEL